MIEKIRYAIFLPMVYFSISNHVAAFELANEPHFLKVNKQLSSTPIFLHKNNAYMLENRHNSNMLPHNKVADSIIMTASLAILKKVKTITKPLFFFQTKGIEAPGIDAVLRAINQSRKVVIIAGSRDTIPESFQKRLSGYHTGVHKDVFKHTRTEQGNSVSTNSYAINDRLAPNTISNALNFHLYDKKLNVHSFSGVQSIVYPLNFTSENDVNTRRDLFGFEYRFKNTDTKKVGYAARARLERDNENQTYYQLGLGVHFNAKKSFKSIGLQYFPVRSGPGYILGIYRTQLTNYNEFKLTKRLKQIATLESNYYTDQQIDVLLLSRTEYQVVESSIFKASPLLEFAYGLGTIDRRDAYPYWIAKRRAYGGGGLAFDIGSEKSKFQMVADAAIFGEIGQASFERYTGNLRYHIKDFTTINAGFEVYTIDNFYSNVFQFGMVYNFK